MEDRELTCIGCPLGCRITVRLNDGRIESISGYTCKIGENYAASEVMSPVRTVTTTVAVRQGDLPVASVKTEKSIPKDKIFDVMEALRGVYVDAPLKIGDVVVHDICGTGVDIVSTKEVKRVG